MFVSMFRLLLPKRENTQCVPKKVIADVILSMFIRLQFADFVMFCVCLKLSWPFIVDPSFIVTALQLIILIVVCQNIIY